jgi:hypothetical protein
MEKIGQADRRTSWRFMVAACVFLILTPYLSGKLPPEAALVLAALVCLPAISILRSGKQQLDWFHPVALFVANFFLLFVANGVVILLGISFILTRVFGPAPDSVYELMNRATLYASGFLMAVYAGYFFRRQGAGRSGESAISIPALGTPHLGTPRNDQPFRRLRLAAWLALGCSYLGCLILILIFGGIGNFIVDPMVFIESRGDFWPMALVWASLWSFGTFYASYVRERKPIDLAALLLTLPTMLFEFLTGGTKMALLIPVVCYLILRNYLVKRWTWKFLPGLAAFTLLVFLVGYAYRGVADSVEFTTGLSQYADDNGSLFATFFGRFYGTDSFMVVLEATDQGYPLQHGRTMADLLYFYVPRAIWPGKPESYSMAFGREFLPATPGAGETFFTPSLPAELYLNFGVVGLLAGGLLSGALLWEVYFRLLLQPNCGAGHLLAYAIVTPYVALFMAGPISTVAEYILMRGACFAACYWFAGWALGPRTKRRLFPVTLRPGETA